MIDVAGHLLSQGAFSLAFSFDFFTFFLFGAINLVSVALNLNPSPVLALNNLVEFLASLLFARNRKLFGQLEGGEPRKFPLVE